MIDLQPRKVPRQGRSRTTVTAILDACACRLVRGGYAGLTTNHIAERAGVSIGTLYEYFPNREAIVAALAIRAFERQLVRMRAALGEARAMPTPDGIEYMLVTGIRQMASERGVFDVLAREASFVFQLPAVVEARAQLDGVTDAFRRGVGGAVSLSDPETDTWLISRMLFGPMVDITLTGEDEAGQERLARQLARLICRMALGRDSPAGSNAATGEVIALGAARTAHPTARPRR
jgi:AcrR family transcriptional regulator